MQPHPTPRRRGLPGWLATAGVLAVHAPALAQVATPVPQNVNPSIESSPLPRVLPAPPPEIGPVLPPVAPATPQAVPAVNVAVRRVELTGVTALPRTQVEALAAGLPGPSVPLSRIEAARLAILNLYRGSGYVLTTVTANVDADGTLRFVVVEGHIAEVKLEGDIGPAATQVLRFLNHLTEEPAISTAVLERWLLLANDIPGVTVRAVLRPSTAEPGALTLVAELSRKAYSGLLTADNRAFRLTGPVESLLVADANSFTEFGEQTEVSLYHTSGDTQDFGQASVQAFVGGSGLSVRLYAGHGVANPSNFLAAIDYKGVTTIAGVSASYPVIRSRDQTLSVSAYLDVLQSTVQATAGTGDESVRPGEDDIQVFRLGADEVVQDTLAGDSRPAVNAASLRVSQGLPFLGGTQDGSPRGSRPNEVTGFQKLSGELSRTQTLFSPYRNATVSLLARLDGQYSGDVLPPAEKFFLGGPTFTRGYYSGQVTGDRAYAATAELDLNTGFPVALFGREFQVNSQFYVFYDRGEAWQSQAIDANARLSSEGVGARFYLTRYTEFDVEGDIRNIRRPNGSDAVAAESADVFFWRVLVRY